MTESMVAFSLTLIRHGETSYNKEGIIQGQLDIPLSDTGHQQAELAGGRLEHTFFSHVFSSDLLRATQTADAILKENKVCSCSIKKDKRLRERKFGDFEGKVKNDLFAAAKKEVGPSKHWTEFVPKGAESYIQVKNRAKSFFHDLCKELVAFVNEADDMDYIPGSVKRRHGGSLGRNVVKAKNGVTCCRRSQSFCNISPRNKSCDSELESIDHLTEQKKRKQENSAKGNNKVSTPEEENIENGAKDQTTRSPDVLNKNSDSNHCTEFDIKSNALNNKTEIGEILLPENPSNLYLLNANTSPEVDPFSSTRTEDDNSEDGDGVSFSSDENVDDKDDDFKCASNGKAASLILKEDDSNGNPVSQSNTENTDEDKKPLLFSNGSCPNVSLSPSLVHRHISSVSSISSGRNSSFDDIDGYPPTIADVLVVSHGGFIKELLKYFSEKLECKLPGGNHIASKICQNCSISKFIVSLSSVTDLPTVSCISFNDRDHMVGMEEAIGKY